MSGAVIDGDYRYSLWRECGSGTGCVLFVGLNPSTADAQKDDQTIRRCVRFARDWGYGTMWMANLYAYRATDPKALCGVADPVGPENDAWLALLALRTDLVVAAWGAWPGPDPTRPQRVRDLMGGTMHVLGWTAQGYPRHPLYMPIDTRPIAWLPEAA